MEDDDVLEKLYLFLKNKIHAEKREFKENEVRFYNKSSEAVIIPVVKRKQAPSLEKKIERNSLEGIPTLLLFGKSFYSKDVSYEGKHGITRRTKTCNDPSIYRVSRPLSTAELMWLEIHGNPIINYHAKNNNISSYNMKRFSFDVVAHDLGKKMKKDIKPFGYYKNDFILRHTCEFLKQNYGEVFRHITKDYHERIKEISMMIEQREKKRQVLIDKNFRQSKVYELMPVRKDKYLFAMPVPYKQTQLGLF